MEKIAGIHNMTDRNKMTNGAKKLRDTYNLVPNAPIYLKEFGYYSLEKWISQGYVKSYEELAEICQFDDPGCYRLEHLGWCEAAFMPYFEEKVIEDRGEHEVIRDFAGRHVLFFKGRRNGYMPEYIDHPVKDMKSWETECKWRLDPATPGRMEALKPTIDNAISAAQQGLMIQLGLIGGYMYLRSLMGPADLPYLFYDDPALIHSCMETWYNLADKVIEEYQKYLTLDEIFFAEDICYNHGLLISPDMMNEFLIPYYQQLLTNVKSRQLDPSRKLYIQVDTDGNCLPAIEIYKKIGMDAMSPFEVASGCDVVEIGQKYPDLIMSGGIDKRILAQGKNEIDIMLDRIMPIMKKRGGFIPTCDHGVPEEVSFENYIHFRKRLIEYSK